MRNKLETKRLKLRPLVHEDAVAFSKYCSEYEIATMTGSIPHPFPLVSAEIKISLMLSKKRRGLAYPYAITTHNDHMIGIADLFKRSPSSDWELGYWIAKPFWGQGFASEAMQCVINEACETLHVTCFIASIWGDNPASGRVLEKLGFNPTGPNGHHFCMARLKKVQSLGFRFECSSLKNAA